MKLPWVGRALYDLQTATVERLLDAHSERRREWSDELTRLREEIASLRAERSALVEHFKRMDRIDHGVTEVPRPPRREIKSISRLAFEHVKSWGSEAMQADVRARLEARHRKGESWDDIDKSLSMESEGNGTTAATS